MNRKSVIVNADERHVPHTRGDEPQWMTDIYGKVIMFPTHVGMNRQHRVFLLVLRHVPHTRGDEPREARYSRLIAACSPHTWG